MNLESMTIVITGAASGIGHALCLGFIEDGAKVLAVDRHAEGLEPLAEKGGITRNIDVSNQTQVEEMVQTALDETGRLDVLINNAGVGFMTLITDHKPGQFEELTRVNLFGPYYGLKAAIPVMRTQGFGRIINLVSRAGEGGHKGMSAYGSSKAALFALTRHAAKETEDDNILVNGLIPGPTKSGMMPKGQDPGVVYPTARMLATFPDDGPSGKVFWNEKEYNLFDPDNGFYQR